MWEYPMRAKIIHALLQNEYVIQVWDEKGEALDWSTDEKEILSAAYGEDIIQFRIHHKDDDPEEVMPGFAEFREDKMVDAVAWVRGTLQDAGIDC